MWPDYAPTLFEPNQWCHKTLYVFALVQLAIVWGVLALLVLLLLTLVVCQCQFVRKLLWNVSISFMKGQFRFDTPGKLNSRARPQVFGCGWLGPPRYK
ncbi:hypothetical protein EVAR_42528_1 [Eumeta japonica]|uniref:Uncharacterized protein n=1 Tax=Eumeta variegata TaxID=151549 RepID=A0A4C1WSJ9_EUMVA|nr:hypothetical protein EVAR_42528_1 [Eumeta japonica]